MSAASRALRARACQKQLPRTWRPPKPAGGSPAKPARRRPFPAGWLASSQPLLWGARVGLSTRCRACQAKLMAHGQRPRPGRLHAVPQPHVALRGLGREHAYVILCQLLYRRGAMAPWQGRHGAKAHLCACLSESSRSLNIFVSRSKRRLVEFEVSEASPILVRGPHELLCVFRVEGRH